MPPKIFYDVIPIFKIEDKFKNKNKERQKNGYNKYSNFCS